MTYNGKQQTKNNNKQKTMTNKKQRQTTKNDKQQTTNNDKKQCIKIVNFECKTDLSFPLQVPVEKYMILRKNRLIQMGYYAVEYSFHYSIMSFSSINGTLEI